MMLRLTPDGSLSLSHSLPVIQLPSGDPSLTRDPLDARSLVPDPAPIYDPTNYPERD